jgi:hypothetical protein
VGRAGWRCPFAPSAPSHGALDSIRKAVGGEAIRRVDFPFGLGCWAGPAGFRVGPSVRRRLSRGASAGAHVESHWPIGVAAVTACGACSGQGFVPIMRATWASAALLWEIPCAAHSWSRWGWEKSFSPARDAGLWALPSMVCAGLKRSHRVPLGTWAVPDAGANLSDQPCGRRYGVRRVLSQRCFFPAGRARCRGEEHSG